MKVTYDPEVDVLRILFRDVPIEESDEDKPGVILMGRGQARETEFERNSEFRA
jgi:hypothetical protein